MARIRRLSAAAARIAERIAPAEPDWGKFSWGPGDLEIVTSEDEPRETGNSE